jgi:hypothetical protein
MSAVEAYARSVGEVRAPRTVPMRPVIAGLVLAPLVVAYVVLRNGGWVYDDNLILVLARQQGFTLGWLDRQIFQHWDVGMNATYSALLHLMPLDYRWGLVAMLVVLGVALFTFERILTTLGSRGWITLSLTVWFGFSIVWIRPLQWWASGVQAMPNLAFDLVCFYAVLRCWAGDGDRWIAIACGALVAGLLFYEKPALMPLYLALIRILLMSENLAPRAVGARFWAERKLWLGLLAVDAVWAVGYLHSGAFNSGGGSVTLGPYVHYFWILWGDTLLPALAGFTLPAAHLDGSQVLAVVTLELAVVALIAISVARKTAAWRAWALIALVVLLDGGLVAHQRIAQFGVGIGNDLRYLLDFPWVVAIAAFYAFSDQRVLVPRTPPRAPRLTLPRPPRARPARVRPLGIAAGAVLAVYAAAAVATTAHLQKIWNPTQSRHWEANVIRSLGALSRHGPLVVADDAVPFQIISYPFAPLNRLSDVLPLYTSGVQVDGLLTGRRLVTIDASGTTRPATVARVLGPQGAVALDRAHQLVITGATPAVRGGAVCMSTGARPSTVAHGVSIRPPAPPPPYYVLAAYTTNRAFTSPLLQDVGNGYPPGTAATLSLTPPANASLAWVDAGFPLRFQITVPPHTRLCLKRFDLVTLAGNPS